MFLPNLVILTSLPVWVPAGSGRTAWSSSARRPDVVGSVILHDKLSLWTSSEGSVHYHQGTAKPSDRRPPPRRGGQVISGLCLWSPGLQSGDNTLNVLCSLRAARSLVSGRFADVSQPGARAAVLSAYVRFLTTPGSHRDTYAESFHRSFFADWQDSRPSSPPQVKQTHPDGTVNPPPAAFLCFF